MRPSRPSARRLVSGIAAPARRAPAVVLAALFAHAVVYRSLWPADGAHAYFAWYAPLVAALSLASLVGLPLLVAGALRGRRDGPAASVARALLPCGATTAEAARLAGSAAVFLLVQETVEHSLERHAPALPPFPLATWALALAALACVAALLVWVGGAIVAAVEALAAPRPSWRGAPRRSPRPRVLESSRRPQPLAVHGALRGPPAAA